MKYISKQSVCYSQPLYPDIDPTLDFYTDLANRIYLLLRKYKEFEVGKLLQEVAIDLVNYYQDVIADGGFWHSFIDECRRLYGRTIPFYDTDEDYLDYELNLEDVRFMMWYLIAMKYSNFRFISPDDCRLAEMSEAVYNLLEKEYENAPIPENWKFLHELDIHDPDDINDVLNAGNWIFCLCYLIVPANILSMSQLLSSVTETDPDKRQEEISEKINKALQTEPVGPLALYTKEWLHIVLGNKVKKSYDKEDSESQEHPYYTKAIKAFNGKTIAYFKTYDELNTFFIDVLGWDEKKSHLSSLKGSEYFVVMINPVKGMLIASDVARCIADPENPYFNMSFAYDHAFRLLTERTLCPADLLRRILSEGWLPDTHFPESDNTAIVKENADFIARCYLQLYYRGD